MKTTLKNNLLNFSLVFLLTLLSFNSCSKDEIISTPQKQGQIKVEIKEINFTEIGKGILDGNGSEGITQSNMVITNYNDWQNLINQMNSVNNVTDEFTETNIDFNTYQVITVFTEIKPTNWEVEISSIIENENNLTVSIIETEFDFTVITQPFHIVKIPITSKGIVFE